MEPNQEGESMGFKNVSPDSLSPEEKTALQELVTEKGAAFVMKGDHWVVQTQELNKREIGPFDSDRSAKEFVGVNPDAPRARLAEI
jgi:hypothetical protein